VKPRLVIGLGNPLMGDEGIGCVLAEHLARDPNLPPDTEVFVAGTDLIGCAGLMEGRTGVTLLDAMLDPAEPGILRVFEDDFTALDATQPSAHQLSVVASLELLKVAYSSLRDIRFRLFAVTATSAEIGQGLSPALTARLPELLDQVMTRISDLNAQRPAAER
jgi:hydrogenase maturation protease